MRPGIAQFLVFLQKRKRITLSSFAAVAVLVISIPVLDIFAVHSITASETVKVKNVLPVKDSFFDDASFGKIATYTRHGYLTARK